MENNSDAQRALLQRVGEVDQASIAVKKADRPQTIFKIELDLSQAKDELEPYPIRFPFKSIFLAKSTDPSVEIYVKPITTDEYQAAFPLGYKDSWAESEVIPKAFLHWPAQPGVKVILYVFTSAEFRSGSQVSLTSGGVSISEGASVAGPTAVNLAAATAAAIAPQDLFRKVATIQNKTGADLYIGSSVTVNATTNEGIKVPNDGVILWKNTGALYGFSVAGGKVTRIEES